MNRREALRRAMVLTAGGVLVPASALCRPPVFNPGAIRNREGSGAAPACTTPRDTNGGTPNSDLTNQDFNWFACDFTAAATATICRAVLQIGKDGTPAQTATFAIHAKGSPNPGAINGTASSSVALSTAPGSPGDLEFAGTLSSTINATTQYTAVLRCSAASGDPANRMKWAYNDNTGFDCYISDNSGSSWTVFPEDAQFRFALYST